MNCCCKKPWNRVKSTKKNQKKKPQSCFQLKELLKLIIVLEEATSVCNSELLFSTSASSCLKRGWTLLLHNSLGLNMKHPQNPLLLSCKRVHREIKFPSCLSLVLYWFPLFKSGRLKIWLKLFKKWFWALCVWFTLSQNYLGEFHGW